MSNSSENLRLDCSSAAAGVPTLTTPTLTPTTLRNIEQIFLEASEGPPVLHQNAAHFVPPAIVLEHATPPPTSEPLPPLPGPDSVEMLHPPLPSPIMSTPDVLVSESNDHQVPLQIKSEPDTTTRVTASSGFNSRTNNNNVISSRSQASDDERKRQLRRERNKEAAARCRKRRLDQIATLQNEVDQLSSVKSEMQQELALLESEKEKLRGVLQVHQCSLKKKS